jgi:hypothetical protein
MVIPAIKIIVASEGENLGILTNPPQRINRGIPGGYRPCNTHDLNPSVSRMNASLPSE